MRTPTAIVGVVAAVLSAALGCGTENHDDPRESCPTALPPTTLGCSYEIECSYVTSTNPCGAADCYCHNEAWSCEPSCISDDASAGVDTGADASGFPSDAATCVAANIVASNYDQSCTVDKDCVAIAEGNVCDPCVFDGMLNAAINASAEAKYNSDIGGTPGAAGIGGAGCTTGGGAVSGNSNWGPFCCSGTCHVGSQCPNTAAAVDAGADIVAEAAADAAGE
jgi:hypothetical protein